MYFSAWSSLGSLSENFRSPLGALKDLFGSLQASQEASRASPGSFQEHLGVVFGFILGSLSLVFLCFLGGSLR